MLQGHVETHLKNNHFGVNGIETHLMDWLGLNVMLQAQVETHLQYNHFGVNGVLQMHVEFEVSKMPTSINSLNIQSISIQLLSNKYSNFQHHYHYLLYADHRACEIYPSW